MSDRPAVPLLPPELAGHRVHLRTLLAMRWVAVAGQTVTLLAAATLLGFELPVGPCAALVGALAATNLAAAWRVPGSTRLGERAVLGILLIDLAQLGALLFLTGGLNNPFALLVVGPVTLAATTLSLRATLLVGALALVSISLLGGYHVPLRHADGWELALPPLYLLGYWVAIVLATLIFGAFALGLTSENDRASRALHATQTALAREQKLHDLSGVIAAAAHELGTPLATIKLVSTELEEELQDADARADVALIRSQADRCRDILRSMGRAGKDDLHMQAAPLETVVSEAAEPHAGRGKALLYDFAAEPGTEGRRPRVRRAPEVIHGLRNLVQNAVDFAESTVRVEGRWSDSEIRLVIEDDGPGYQTEMLARLGDPFLRVPGARDAREDYEGMGLGLFISKTLLERTGARLSFGNRRAFGRRRGATVEIVWPRARLEVTRTALGENPTL
ncbi:sensor histidine kinase RegB [Jannaschia sp. W003]|uniref:sensor histidine kinase RegB n=1 Tax=Jannaschia sp. W003 TaxID=2867012 RepID=UPI0021A4B56F|nr:ActS/PrrB/RegB family redox-sensitive histidine kinase [Jannaschia sp. W003]UWQ21611.1 ActS/PrrB/RegB family redox-sensitive histidine kinase [Jannaschia sp. W003]